MDPARTPVIAAVGQSIERDEIVDSVEVAARASESALRAAPGLRDRIELWGYRLSMRLFGQTAEEGARSLVFAASDPGVVGGGYYGPTGFGQPRHYLTDMLVLSEEDAQYTVYSPDSGVPVEPVGPACRSCPRRDCAHRVAAPLAGRGLRTAPALRPAARERDAATRDGHNGRQGRRRADIRAGARARGSTGVARSIRMREGRRAILEETCPSACYWWKTRPTSSFR